MAMPMRDFRILEKSMMQTTSDNDAEALTALRMANAILKKNGYTWTSAFQRLVKVEDSSIPDVEDGSDTLPQDAQESADPDAPRIEEAFARLERINLGPGTQKFIDSLREQWLGRRFLSPKQKDSLFRNADEFR